MDAAGPTGLVQRSWNIFYIFYALNTSDAAPRWRRG